MPGPDGPPSIRGAHLDDSFRFDNGNNSVAAGPEEPILLLNIVTPLWSFEDDQLLAKGKILQHQIPAHFEG